MRGYNPYIQAKILNYIFVPVYAPLYISAAIITFEQYEQQKQNKAKNMVVKRSS